MSDGRLARLLRYWEGLGYSRFDVAVAALPVVAAVVALVAPRVGGAEALMRLTVPIAREICEADALLAFCHMKETDWQAVKFGQLLLVHLTTLASMIVLALSWIWQLAVMRRRDHTEKINGLQLLLLVIVLGILCQGAPIYSIAIFLGDPGILVFGAFGVVLTHMLLGVIAKIIRLVRTIPLPR